jgi:hypothetical protein
MIYKSSKRSYVVSISVDIVERVNKYLSTMSREDTQKYIDDNFKMASILGAKSSSGAHRESRIHLDKAKIAILYLDDFNS